MLDFIFCSMKNAMFCVYSKFFQPSCTEIAHFGVAVRIISDCVPNTCEQPFFNPKAIQLSRKIRFFYVRQPMIAASREKNHLNLTHTQTHTHTRVICGRSYKEL